MSNTQYRYLKAIIWRLRKLGVYLHPLLIVREAMAPTESEISIDPKFDYLQLTEADLPDVAQLRPTMDIERYRRFLREGKLCFGLKDGARLVANMWMDLKEINSAYYKRPLQDHEAYLFDAFSDNDYRGQNLAPYLRLKCYAEAHARGRTDVYSYTDFVNVPARRFKAKLGARDVALVVYFELFGGTGHSVTVWKYPQPR
jgi:GNAT superfamily N-acetyltransferase